MPNIYETIEKFKQELNDLENTATMNMIRRYGAVYRGLNQRIGELIDEFTEKSGDMTLNTTQWAREYKRITELQLHIENELMKFGKLGDKELAKEVNQGTKYAQIHAEQIVGKIAQQAGTQITWNQAPIDLLQTFTGQVTKDSPLYKMLAIKGEDVAKKTTNAILVGMAAGQPAAVVARAIRKEFATVLTQAMVIARTEINRAYRETTRAIYQQNPDVITGYIRKSARTAKTCAACWAMDGAEFRLDQPLGDHPNGRCFMIPKVRGAENDPLYHEKSGEEAFKAQPAAVQRKVLGTVKYELYKEGKLQLSELIEEHHSPEWGSMVTEKSLDKLYGKEQAAKIKNEILAKYWHPDPSEMEIEAKQTAALKELEKAKKKAAAAKKKLEAIKPPITPTMWSGHENINNRLAPPKQGQLYSGHVKVWDHAKTLQGDQDLMPLSMMAKTENVNQHELYHCSTEGFTKSGNDQFNKIGDALYLGQDPKALWDFYGFKAFDEDLHPDAKVYKFTIKPDAKIYHALNQKSYEILEAEALKFAPKAKYPIKEYLLSQGYDGMTYFDPYATGEEWAIFNLGKLKLEGQIDWNLKAVRGSTTSAFDDLLIRLDIASGYEPEDLPSIKAQSRYMTTKLTPEQNSAIRSYTGSLYIDVNEALRREKLEWLSPRERESVPRIIEALKNAPPIKEDMVVYRGSEDFDPKLKIGDKMIDKGFMSTTTKKGKEFSGTKYEILVPAGSKGGAFIKEISMHEHEREFLFAPGAGFRVIDVQTDHWGYKRYTLVYEGR